MYSELPEYFPKLLIAIEVVSFFIIGLLGIGSAIRAASLYARAKAAKKVVVPVEDGKILQVEQEQGKATIICNDVAGIPDEVKTHVNQDVAAPVQPAQASADANPFVVKPTVKAEDKQEEGK